MGGYLAIFQTLDTRQLEEWVRSEPASIFVRRAWYLYELLVGRQLNVHDIIPSGYIDLLDMKIHITGPRRLIRRQRINDNLLGIGGYSPLVRRTNSLRSCRRQEDRRINHDRLQRASGCIVGGTGSTE